LDRRSYSLEEEGGWFSRTGSRNPSVDPILCLSLTIKLSTQMADGIDNSSVVCVFITSRYIQKASGKGETGADDNCKFEVIPL